MQIFWRFVQNLFIIVIYLYYFVTKASCKWLKFQNDETNKWNRLQQLLTRTSSKRGDNLNDDIKKNRNRRRNLSRKCLFHALNCWWKKIFTKQCFHGWHISFVLEHLWYLSSFTSLSNIVTGMLFDKIFLKFVGRKRPDKDKIS